MVLIRPAGTADLPAITAIINEQLATTTYEWTETPHTVEERSAWLTAHQQAGDPVLVAVESGGDVVGWTAYGDFRDARRWPGYRFTVEHSVHVTERHWGRGVGRSLVDTLADQARAAGKRVIVAAIDGSNTRSIAFHRRLAFRPVGHLPGIGEKAGRRLDLVLMQRDLEDPQKRR